MKTTGPGLINDILGKIPEELRKKINLLPHDQFNFCNDCSKCNPSKTKIIYSVHDYQSYWNNVSWLQFRKIFSCLSLVELTLIFIIIIILLILLYRKIFMQN